MEIADILKDGKTIARLEYGSKKLIDHIVDAGWNRESSLNSLRRNLDKLIELKKKYEELRASHIPQNSIDQVNFYAGQRFDEKTYKEVFANEFYDRLDPILAPHNIQLALG